ncbi:MAG TPA: hypothetical protein VFW73_10760, partial [Lacipirellulaceae bacterium]|nr:hypothetical protein [Lacipirellulaceae bacterium]
MKKSTNNSAVPAVILRKLHLVRKRMLTVQIATALVAAAAVLLVAMGIAMLIDWLATLYDSRWRFVLTAAATTTAAATSFGWIIYAWRRNLQIEQVAAEVDQQLPRLEERWTTMTRLGDDATKPAVVHPAMLRRLSKEAASWEPHVDPDQVVSLSTLMRALVGLTAVTAVLALAVVLNPREVTVLARRFWAPNASISATQIVDVPGNLVIARGDPLALTANINGTPVENATLFLRPPAKPAEMLTLVAERTAPIGFSHRMRTVEEPFAYRFRAGDGQTGWYNVEVADRPEIAAIKLTVTPPSYTRQPAKTFDKLPERVSALRNSRIDFAVRPKSFVQAVQLMTDSGKQLDVPLASDGWYRWSARLTESFSITPVLIEQHGLTNRQQPRCMFIAYEDQPPVVKVLSPSDQMAVRPDDELQITFSATDDVGIGSAELVVYKENGGLGPTQLAAMPIDLGEQQGSRNVQKTVDLDLKKFAAKEGAELSYEIRVREDRGTTPTHVAANQRTARNAKKQPQMTANAARNPGNSSLAISKSEFQAPSAISNSQAMTGSPTSANSGQPNAEASRQAMSGKPSAGAMTSNGNENEKQSPSATSPRPSDQDNASSFNSASPGSPANVDKTASATDAPAGNDPRNDSNGKRHAARNSPERQQAVGASAKPSGAQSASTQQSGRSPDSNSNAATNPHATTKPRRSDSQSSANNSVQMAKNQTPSNSASLPKYPTEPPAPRTATSGRQSVMASSSANVIQQPPTLQPERSSPNSYTSDAKNKTPSKQQKQPTNIAQATKNASNPNASTTTSRQQSPR